MTHRFPPDMVARTMRRMAEVTRLTRTGRLTDATAEIQRQLAGKAPDAGGASDQTVEGDLVRPNPPPAFGGQGTAAPRLRLGETLRRIAAGRMPTRGVDRSPVAPVPQGASFTTRTYHGPEGSREYMLYLPASAARTAAGMPLVIMLHGCTQSSADFALGTGMNELAEVEGFVVAYPVQTTAANISRCWNWFQPADQSRDGGEPAILAGITRDIQQAENIDTARTFVAGLSAGGAAAVILAQAYPDLFAAVGVHSGLPLGAAVDVPSAFAAMRSGAAGRRLVHAVPTIVFHGSGDQTVDLRNGRAVTEQAQSRFAGQKVVETGQSSGGRHYERVALVHDDGRSSCEFWLIDGAPHAWAGGNSAGSYTDPSGPDASSEMLKFFRQHRLAATTLQG